MTFPLISLAVMDKHGELTAFELAIVVPKREEKDECSKDDCVERLVGVLEKAGMIIERVEGISDEFIKVDFFSLYLNWVLFKRLTQVSRN